MPAEGGEGEVRRGAPRSPDWKRGRWSEVKAQFKATWHKLAAQEVLRGTAPALGEVEGELRAAGLPPEAALSALVWLVWRTRPRTSQLPHQPSGAGLYRVILREQIERGGLAAWGAAPPPTLHELAAVWRGLSPEGLLQERGLDLGDGADEGETGSEGSFQAPPPPENALQTPRNEVAEAFSPRGDELVEARQVLARVRAALGLSGMSLAVALEGAIQAGDVARVRAASETARELLALKGAA